MCGALSCCKGRGLPVLRRTGHIAFSCCLLLPTAQAQEKDARICYERIAIDHVSIAPKMEAQVRNGEPINLQRTTRRELGHVPGSSRTFSIEYLPIPARLLAGWTLKPFKGRTGLLHWDAQTYQQESLLGFIGIHQADKVITIAFRGSVSLYDFANNLNMGVVRSKLIPYPGYLHDGYHSIFEAMLPDFEALWQEAVADLPDLEAYTFVVTGYSLGGSLATLMASYLITQPAYRSYLRRDNVRLILFAAPSVGFRYKKNDFSRWLGARIQYIKRFERMTDMAPQVSHLAKLRWREGSWRQLYTPLTPAPVGVCVTLPNYGDSVLNFYQAHRLSKYRRGVYESLGLTYTPLSFGVVYKASVKRTKSATDSASGR